MGGFLNQSHNLEFKQSLYEIILDILIKCSSKMKEDCLSKMTKIANHEERIRNHLLENYLENNNVRSIIGYTDIHLRFMAESPETYDKNNDTYIGRVDIKVVSENWFRNKNDYYIIECKRIDGSSNLNKKYIYEGICRFVEPPYKYLFSNNINIMFGFVVKGINIIQNTSQISKLHEEKLKKITKRNLTLVKSKKENQICFYKSKYIVKNKNLELHHLFYDFSSIIKNN